MSNARTKERAHRLPEIKPGKWRGEILGSCTVNFGQTVQPGEPRRSVEFTYMIMPEAFTAPDARFAWPGVVMIMAPTPMRQEAPDAGHLFIAEHLPSLHVSLEVTRALRSKMLHRLDRKKDPKAYWELPHVAGKPFILAIQTFYEHGALGFSNAAVVRYLLRLRALANMGRRRKSRH